jgi:hypothetical protein
VTKGCRIRCYVMDPKDTAFAVKELTKPKMLLQQGAA